MKDSSKPNLRLKKDASPKQNQVHQNLRIMLSLGAPKRESLSQLEKNSQGDFITNTPRPKSINTPKISKEKPQYPLGSTFSSALAAYRLKKNQENFL